MQNHKGSQTVLQPCMNTRAHTHTGSNPVVCAELFSVTDLHCSAVICATHVPRVKGQVSALRSTSSGNSTSWKRAVGVWVCAATVWAPQYLSASPGCSLAVCSSSVKLKMMFFTETPEPIIGIETPHSKLTVLPNIVHSELKSKAEERNQKLCAGFRLNDV